MLCKTQVPLQPLSQPEEPAGKAAVGSAGTAKAEDHAATAGKVTLGDILGSKLDLTMAGKGKIPPPQPSPAEEPVEIPVVTDVPPEDVVLKKDSAETEAQEEPEPAQGAEPLEQEEVKAGDPDAAAPEAAETEASEPEEAASPVDTSDQEADSEAPAEQDAESSAKSTDETPTAEAAEESQD